MKSEWFRRGGLIDYERLDRRKKILTILIFAILQPIVLLPAGAAFTTLVLIFIIIPNFGIIPPTFMEETPQIVGYPLITFVALSGFFLVSLPIAFFTRLPARMTVLLAILSVPGVFLWMDVYSKIFLPGF